MFYGIPCADEVDTRSVNGSESQLLATMRSTKYGILGRLCISGFFIYIQQERQHQHLHLHQHWAWRKDGFLEFFKAGHASSLLFFSFSSLSTFSLSDLCILHIQSSVSEQSRRTHAEASRGGMKMGLTLKTVTCGSWGSISDAFDTSFLV
jgi:hypothetical protein